MSEAKELRDCDLIMKGGLTSGVVFPHAVREIAGTYRLHSVGGTSAGAIAAALAVAAEHRRQSSPDRSDMAGFDMIGDLADDLARNLKSLFQPEEPFRSLFELILRMQAGQGPKSLGLRFAVAALMSHSEQALRGLVPGLVVVLIGLKHSGWLVVIGLLLMLAGIVLSVTVALRNALARDLPKADFGMCQGKRCGAWKGSSFGEWIADNIDRIAGRDPAGPPLTVGELAQHEPPKGRKPDRIEIAAMTTDITSQRPYRLPLKSDVHYFSRREFEKLFPQRIVDHLCTREAAYESEDPNAPGDLFRMPKETDFPVFLVARMSLSFPVLIRCVPLWRRDVRLRPNGSAEGSDHIMVRCLFTDGGLSSNFPVHFFDNILPNRPTLGIALGALPEDADPDGPRHKFLNDADTVSALPAQPIGGLADFAFAMLNTAKDWQDTLRALLHGYRDRNIYVLLKPDEGGLNLGMDRKTVERLAGYGRAAGRALVAEFCFDDHRRRRADAAVPKVAAMLHEIDEVLSVTGPGTYQSVLTQPMKGGADPFQMWRSGPLLTFMQALARLSDGGLSLPPGFPEIAARVRLRSEET